MKKSKKFNYRAIYKELRKYYSFTFKLPHHKKDFSPQQKSAIKRKFEKIYPYVDGNFKPKTDEVTFLKYPKKSKLPNIDGVRTDAGIFYKWPKAELIKNKNKTNSYTVVVAPKILKGATLMEKRRDVFYPFPKSIIDDIDKIKIYVDKLKEKYNPHDVMWSTRDLRERQAYMPDTFDLYFSPVVNTIDSQIDLDAMTDKEILKSDEYQELDRHDQAQLWKIKKMRGKHKKKPNHYNGVFLIYYLN